MTPCAHRPWPLLVALLIGALVAAWPPVLAMRTAPATALTPVVGAQSRTAHGLADVSAQPLPTVRIPTVRASSPVHARHWSWHRGVSRRTGRDVQAGLSTAALPGSIPAQPTFTDRDARRVPRWAEAAARGVSRGAASPRAPPSLN